jgi:hypothetical protein
MRTTAPFYGKSRCCGNCKSRSKYKIGGDMYGYDDGDYLCGIHKEYTSDCSETRKLRVELTDVCGDFEEVKYV